MWVKSEANSHEKQLLKRGQKYISKLAKIPGIEMIAIVNSLSMYTTHPNSDIDLFIITKPWMIWFVRFWATLVLWTHWVWRRDADIAGNLCLSFFITTEAMDLSRVAIEKDIYLYYWIYYMRPIIDQDRNYEKFLSANSWVDIDEEQKILNSQYFIYSDAHFASSFWEFCRSLNSLIRHFLLPHTLRTYEKMWRPEWVVISDQILKFHDRDRREVIRDTILENNFDK